MLSLALLARRSYNINLNLNSDLWNVTCFNQPRTLSANSAVSNPSIAPGKKRVTKLRNTPPPVATTIYNDKKLPLPLVVSSLKIRFKNIVDGQKFCNLTRPFSKKETPSRVGEKALCHRSSSAPFTRYSSDLISRLISLRHILEKMILKTCLLRLKFLLAMCQEARGFRRLMTPISRCS